MPTKDRSNIHVYVENELGRLKLIIQNKFSFMCTFYIYLIFSDFYPATFK